MFAIEQFSTILYASTNVKKIDFYLHGLVMVHLHDTNPRLSVFLLSSFFLPFFNSWLSLTERMLRVLAFRH